MPLNFFFYFTSALPLGVVQGARGFSRTLKSAKRSHPFWIELPDFVSRGLAVKRDLDFNLKPEFNSGGLSPRPSPVGMFSRRSTQG